MDLQNDFTTGNNLYPKSGPQTLHLLDKYINKAAPNIPASKGSLFSQGDVNKGNGGRLRCNNRSGDDKTYGKRYWRYKECYKYGEKGHPPSRCTKTKTDKDNDYKSTNTTRSRASVNKIAKDVKKISRGFTTVNTQLQHLKEADSDLSDSENEDEASHFQMAKINFGKVTSSLQRWTRNSNPTYQVF